MKLMFVVHAAHMFSRHGVCIDNEMSILQCPTCQFVTDKRCRFNDHMKMHQNIRDIPCSQCGKLFVTKKTLRQHINKVHRHAQLTAPSTVALSRVMSCGLGSFHSVTGAEMIDNCQKAPLDKMAPVTVVGVSEYLMSGAATGGQLTADGFNVGAVLSHPHVVSQCYDKSSSVVVPSVGAPASSSMTENSTPVEYQMLLPIPSTSNGAVLQHVDGMSVATVNSIIVGIPLPVENSSMSYANFQPFDVSNRLVGL